VLTSHCIEVKGGREKGLVEGEVGSIGWRHRWREKRVREVEVKKTLSPAYIVAR